MNKISISKGTNALQYNKVYYTVAPYIFKLNGNDDKTTEEKTFHFVCRALSKIKYALCVLQIVYGAV